MARKVTPVRTALVSLRPLPGDTLLSRTMGRRRFAAANGLDTAGVEDTPSELRVLPREKAIALFDTLKSGPRVSGISFVDGLDWIWATHVGLVVQDSGKAAVLRHASSRLGEVSEQKLSDYLRSRPKLAGIVLWDVVAPRAGP